MMARAEARAHGDDQAVILDRFAGHLEWEASPEQAARWLGLPPTEGKRLLAELCKRLGPQSA